MTHEEAIKVLRWALNRLEGHHYITDDYGTVDPSAKVNAFGMAIEALEKQEPMKPNDKFNVPYAIIAYGICPSCGLDVNSDMKFCSECGQAIDWGVSELHEEKQCGSGAKKGDCHSVSLQSFRE